MKVSCIIMVWVVTASLISGEPLQAAKWGNGGKSIVNSFADVGGLGRFRELRGKLGYLPDKMAYFFTKPADGGYSPVRRTIAAVTLASTCWWGAVSMTGCATTRYNGKQYYSADSEAVHATVGVVFVVGGAFAITYLIIKASLPRYPSYPNIPTPRHHRLLSNLDGIEQHRLARDNLLNHSMIVDNETYRGVLITYRDGVDTRTGLAFSPNAPLVFSTQGSEQGMLGFLADDPSFQPPEEITVKHPDGETPDAVINLTQVENVLLTEEPAPQELLFSE